MGASEVWPGHIPWHTPRYVEEFGQFGVGFSFMDHKGTRFHEDLGDLRASKTLGPRSRLLCDNVLKPGAPDHLWMHHRADSSFALASNPSEGPSCIIWAMHEFLEPDMEDWQSLRDDIPGY